MRAHARLRVFAGSLPPTFWVIWWGVLLNRAASFVLGFLALFLVQERGYDLATAGRVVALYGVGGVLAATLGGTLADLVGRRLTILLGLGLSAASVGALAVVRTPALIAGVTLLAGGAGQLYPPALNAAVADVVPFQDRPRAFGLTYWAANVGFGIGFALAAAVGPHSLPALFLLDAATTAAFLALVLWRLPETRPAVAVHHPVRAGLGHVLRDGVFVTFLGLHLVVLLVFTQWSLLFGVDTAAHGVGRAGYALLLCLNCVGAIVLQPLLSTWIARGDPTHALAASALFVGTGYGLNAFATTLPGYAAGVLLWTVGEVLCLPVASALAASLAPPALRGRYQGAYVLVMSGAFALSPWLSGELAARAGARAVWLACFAAGVAVALGHLAVAAPRRRRLAARARQAAAEECPPAAEPAT